MTDRLKGFTITLEEDFREDDMERLKNALEMHKSVLHVEPVLVTSEDHMNRTRIRLELIQKMLEILNEK